MRSADSADRSAVVPGGMPKRRAWLLAVRPATLPAALGPVLVGLGVELAVAVKSGVSVGVGVRVRVGQGVGERRSPGVAVFVRVGVRVGKMVSEGVRLGVADGTGVSVLVGSGPAVERAIGLSVMPSTGGALHPHTSTDNNASKTTRFNIRQIIPAHDGPVRPALWWLEKLPGVFQGQSGGLNTEPQGR